MRFLLALILCVGSQTWAHSGQKSGEKSIKGDEKKFGSPLNIQNQTPLGDILASHQDYIGKAISFEATAKKVCQKKGCWMVLEDGDHKVRTLFKDYGFFVPASILGRKVRVQGKMEQKKLSAATIRHFMKDEGKSSEDIQKVKKGETRFQFVADGVEIL